MRIVFAGTPRNAATTLSELVKAGIEVGLVLTREDAPQGRKRVLTPSPVALAAEELGLEIVKTSRFDDALISKIKAAKVSLGVVVAYGVLLKKPALEALELGWYNVHYSELPKWRGAAPVQRALEAGDSQTGVTLFKLDEGLDTGDIYGIVPATVSPSETAGDLLPRLTGLGVSLLLEQLPRIFAGIATGTPQSQVGVTHASKPTRADARLSPASEAKVLENKVRAFNPEPGAWLETESGIVKVHRAREIVPAAPLSVGALVQREKRVLLGCGNDSALELLEVQPAGKNPMPAADWFRGIDPEMSVIP